MDVSGVTLSLPVALALVVSVGGGIIGLGLFLSTKFTKIDKDRAKADIEHENLRNRVGALEKGMDGFVRVMDKIESQSKIQTELLTKMAETKTQVTHLIEGQADMKRQITDDFRLLTQRLDTVIAGCLTEDLKKERRE